MFALPELRLTVESVEFFKNDFSKAELTFSPRCHLGMLIGGVEVVIADP